MIGIGQQIGSYQFDALLNKKIGIVPAMTCEQARYR